jgi:hypothetical protein
MVPDPDDGISTGLYGAAPFPDRALHLDSYIDVIPVYSGPRNWFGGSSRVVVARGNPVGFRDCPAAVSGNDLRLLDRQEALGPPIKVLGSDGQ